MQFQINYSKNKVACLWEKSGLREGKHYSQIITNKDGHPKRPLLIKNNLYFGTDEHALLPISKDNYIVNVERDEEGVEVKVFKVKSIIKDVADTNIVHHYKNGQWSAEPEFMLYDAIESAIKKSKDTHTFAPYFVML